MRDRMRKMDVVEQYNRTFITSDQGSNGFLCSDYMMRLITCRILFNYMNSQAKNDKLPTKLFHKSLLFAIEHKTVDMCELVDGQCVWPVLAGDEADLLSLVLGADLPGLPPLLVPAVQHVEHVPEPEAQRLAEEATVRCLVIVEKSPEWGGNVNRWLHRKNKMM